MDVQFNAINVSNHKVVSRAHRIQTKHQLKIKQKLVECKSVEIALKMQNWHNVF